MEIVFVTPREGGLVRMPDKGSMPMPKEGTFVPRSIYYERLIATGDVVVDEKRKFEPPKAEETEVVLANEPAPAAPAASAPHSKKGAR